MSSSKKIAIVDYGMGNLFSVKSACDAVGLDAMITSDKQEIINAAGLILPGVGAFKDAMINLGELDLIGAIKSFAAEGNPIMCICLGMQLMFTESEEFGNHKGLDLVQGKVIKFPSHSASGDKIRIPHIGWNKVLHDQEFDQDSPMRATEVGSYMYFLHSFYVVPKSNEIITGETIYEGVKFCSALKQNNIFAMQFHPEKSGEDGLEIYTQFKELIK